MQEDTRKGGVAVIVAPSRVIRPREQGTEGTTMTSVSQANVSQVEPRHEYVEVRGLRLHYVDYGSPYSGAPDLVLLHGLSSAWGAWRRIAAHWSTRYRVIGLDHRGHGDSQWAGADQYQTQDYVAELEDFVDAIGLGRFILVGQSMGGHHAIAYTARHPERVIAAIVNDIPPSMEHVMKRDGQERLQRDPSVQREPVRDLDEWKRRQREKNPLTPDWAVDLAAAELLRKVDGGWEPKHDPAVMRWDPDNLWDDLRTVTRPMLFIRGGRSDVVTPQLLQDMDMAVDAARSVTLEKAGHSTFWDMEHEWISIASAFLEAHDR